MSSSEAGLRRKSGHGRRDDRADLRSSEHRFQMPCVERRFPHHQDEAASFLEANVPPASAGSSCPSTLRSESGYRTYIITSRRITSGELLKNRNGLLIARTYHLRTAISFPSAMVVPLSVGCLLMTRPHPILM